MLRVLAIARIRVARRSDDYTYLRDYIYTRIAALVLSPLCGADLQVAEHLANFSSLPPLLTPVDT